MWHRCSQALSKGLDGGCNRDSDKKFDIELSHCIPPGTLLEVEFLVENNPDNLIPDLVPLPSQSGAAFTTTHWSIVFSVNGNDQTKSAAALEWLCQSYWYPVYAFVRRSGVSSHEAEDLTQSFFAQMLEKETIKRADREKGRFRSFLLAALTNFLKNERDKRQTLKRGGGCQIVSLDETVADERYRREPVDPVTPEKLFERRWAMTIFELTFARLQTEYTAAGKAGLFAKLEPLITGEIQPGRYEELAAALGMSLEAVRMALSRLRRRFGELLRSEVAQTVLTPADIDDEIRHLFSVFSLIH
jgi:RNA polymerase sigma factor (sigma-70 family)